MALKSFYWEAPAFMLLRLLPFQTGMKRFRHNASLPLPFLFWSLSFLFQLSESLWDLALDLDNDVHVSLSSIFFTASLAFAFIRPTNVEKSLLHPVSFQKHFSGHVSMLLSQLSLRLSQQGQRRPQPNTRLQFFIVMLCCPLLPLDCPGPV